MESFSITVNKEELHFEAAHLITFEDGGRDRLHGHSYRVGVTVTAPPNASGYVCDFVALRRLAREILEPIDHTLLLPTGNPRLRIERDEREVRVRLEDGTLTVPADDVSLLTISNTTTELLAGYLADRLWERLPEIGVDRIDCLEIELEESAGISAWAVRRPNALPADPATE